MTEAYYQQHQLIFRVPETLTDTIKKVIDNKDEMESAEELDEREKNINNFTILPESNNATDNRFRLTLDGVTYPALLYNLPTIIETHKTFDKKNYTKTGEIGQVLHVFASIKELEEFAKNKIKKTIHGEYGKSGLTSPTNDIVSRRFDRTNNIAALQQSVPAQILEVINDINATWDAETSAQREEKEVRETVYEEVVDFEDWMVSKEHPNGIIIQLEGQNWASCPEFQILLDHPEILNLQHDAEYDKYMAINENKSSADAQLAFKDNSIEEYNIHEDFQQSEYNVDDNDEDDDDWMKQVHEGDGDYKEGDNDEDDNDRMKEVQEGDGDDKEGDNDEDDNEWMKEVHEGDGDDKEEDNDEDDNEWMKEV